MCDEEFATEVIHIERSSRRHERDGKVYHLEKARQEEETTFLSYDSRPQEHKIVSAFGTGTL